MGTFYNEFIRVYNVCGGGTGGFWPTNSKTLRAPLFILADRPNCDKFPSLKCAHIAFLA